MTISGSDYSPRCDHSLGNRAGLMSLQQVSHIRRGLVKPSLDFICGLLKMCSPLGASLMELRAGLLEKYSSYIHGSSLYAVPPRTVFLPEPAGGR